MPGAIATPRMLVRSRDAMSIDKLSSTPGSDTLLGRRLGGNKSTINGQASQKFTSALRCYTLTGGGISLLIQPNTPHIRGALWLACSFQAASAV
jgi:hypothetical protein